MKLLLTSVLIPSLLANRLGPIDYANHKLVDIEIKNEANFQTYENFSKADNIYTWRSVKIGTVKAHILQSSLPFKAVQESLQTLIDAEKAVSEPRSGALADPLHSSFHTTNEIYAFMDDLIVESNGLTTSIAAGQTYQGKTICGVKITTPGDSNKKAFIIHSGIHTREWITVSTAAYLIDQLITQSSSNADLKLLVDTFEVIIIPVLNVDDYDYIRQSLT